MARVEFEAEPGEVVPGYLLRPKKGQPPFPTMICLQGHAPGMHISIGRAKSAKEKALIAGGRDIAIQAVRHGWAALVLEQRALGERAEEDVTCNTRALCDLLRGRPLTGQRVLDVMRAVEFIGTQADLDANRIGCMGNSAGLIAPRHLVFVADKQDQLARFDGVEQGFQTARQCFSAAGCPDHVTLLAAEGGHQFYPELAWPVVQNIRDCWSPKIPSTRDRHDTVEPP